MTDVFTKKKRSWIMSKIKGKGTKLEDKGFLLLRSAGMRFRKHPKGIFGRPDAANKKFKIAFFFDSDFWHGFNYSTTLKKRLPNAFWIEKIARNIKRDVLVTKRLKKEGWVVIRFWEHDLTKQPERSMRRVLKAMADRGVRVSKKR